MRPSPTYFFFILLLCCMPVLYGQEAENTPPLPPSAGPEGLRAGGNDFGIDEVRGEIRARLDSLPLGYARGRQSKAARHVAEAEEKAAKIASRIDSLGHNLQGFENLGGLRVGDKPGLGKVKISELKGASEYILGGLPLKRDRLGTGAGDILNSRTCCGISLLEHGIPPGDLTKRIDGQIRNLAQYWIFVN